MRRYALRLRHLLALAMAFLTASEVFGLQMTQQIIKPSDGPIVPGEWNKRFDKGLEKANAENIPLFVFMAGLSCGACEDLQRACTNDEFKAWQAQKKVIMIFAMDASYGNVQKFTKVEDGSSESGFPQIAAYWNRYGEVPAKHTQYYSCFRGKNGCMPVKSGSLTRQLIDSLELVFGEYPYAGGDFEVPSGQGVRLEIEAGYASGTKVNVPLTRTGTAAYVNYLTCAGQTVEVRWAAGESGEKIVPVTLPDGLAAGATLPLTLLTEKGSAHSSSEIAVVSAQPNSLRNPAWLGEAFAAGEWTMDLEAVKARAGAGDFDHVLMLFTGALWCPHCQGLEDGVFAKAEFKSWCEANRIALVELDNPRRSSSDAATDYGIREATGAPPTLLRYAAGNNSYAGRVESGASYLTRKGIAVHAAEGVLQRNRGLGYAWGEGTYCAPGAGRCGYPTLILLDADGSVAGRFNRLEGDNYAHDLTENMARLKELLKLANGAGESGNYPSTTTLELLAGGATVDAPLQVNSAVRYFKLRGLPTGKVSFVASGAPAGNAVTLSVIRFSNGAETVLASGTGAVTASFDADADCLLKVGAFSEKRAYGENSGFTASIASSIVLVPREKTSVFVPGDRSFKLEICANVRYRLEGFAAPDGACLRDEGEAEDGGRYYTALVSGECVVSKAAEIVKYQVWNPGTVTFDRMSMTLFTFTKSGVVKVTRAAGSSGSVSAKVKVVGGDAENGVRYEWNDETEVSWLDGESGTREIAFPLKTTGTLLANQSFVLAFRDICGSAAQSVSAGELTVTLCDTDKPVLPQTEYAVSMTATFDAQQAMPAQQAFNVKAGKVTIKKVDGKLPSGVKLVYEDGVVKLSGSAKKPGPYEYTFALQQRQDGEMKTGPEITIRFEVAVASSANAFLDRKLRATVPLYAREADVLVPRGVLEFSTTAKNKITAKYVGLRKAKATFKGLWGTMNGGLAETGVLQTKSGETLRLSLDAQGHLQAEFRDGSSAEALESGAGNRVGTDAYAGAFSGAYTASLLEETSDDPAGCGYILLKSVSSTGKASWKGVLANGRSLSGTAYVMLDDGGCAVVAVFKSDSKDSLAAVLRLRPNAQQLLFPRAVKTYPGTKAQWEHVVTPASTHTCEVRGSFYDKSGSVLDSCCYAQFFQTNLLFSAVLSDFASGKYGQAKSAASGEVVVLPKTIKLSEKVDGLKFSFSKSTGVVKGTVLVQFAEKSVKATYQGVVLPGWHDCGCEGPTAGEPFGLDVSLPFVLGATWISDKVDGVSVKRGFTVKVDVSE